MLVLMSTHNILPATMKPKLKGKSIAKDTTLEVTVSWIIHYIHENKLHSANTPCKLDLVKLKLAYTAMYDPCDGF